MVKLLAGGQCRTKAGLNAYPLCPRPPASADISRCHVAASCVVLPIIDPRMRHLPGGPMRAKHQQFLESAARPIEVQRLLPAIEREVHKLLAQWALKYLKREQTSQKERGSKWITQSR